MIGSGINYTSIFDDVFTNNFIIQDSGTFVFQFKDSILLAERKIKLEKGEYLLSANNVSLLANRQIKPATGTFSFHFSDAEWLWSKPMYLDTGNFVLTGKPLTLLVKKGIKLEKGIFLFNGRNVALNLKTSVKHRVRIHGTIKEPLIYGHINDNQTIKAITYNPEITATINSTQSIKGFLNSINLNIVL